MRVAMIADGPSRPRKPRASRSPSRWAASRLVRFDTGRKSEAVFASQTVANANGIGDRPFDRATATTTGVSSTAVVSRERNAVTTAAKATTASQRTMTRPRDRRASRAAAASNTPACAASSATIVTATTNSRIGHTRSPISSAASSGRSPKTTAAPPRSSSTAPITASITASTMDPPRPVPCGDRLQTWDRAGSAPSRLERARPVCERSGPERAGRAAPEAEHPIRSTFLETFP